MIKCDFHNHTSFSADSESSPESMIERAIELGLSYLCITDHMDLDMDLPDMDFTFDTNKYFHKHQQLKEQYSDHITLLTGIELGLQPHLNAELTELLKSHDFDFVIGSSHLCDKIDPYYAEYWHGKTEYQATYRYFESILENLHAFDDIDVYGHIDYVVRYGPTQADNYSYSKYKEILDEILKALIAKNIGLELNTGGLKYGLGFAHPHTDVLKHYKELGGEIITIGSDAHKPEHLAYDFSKVPSILKEAGFEYYTIFKNRTPEFIKL